MALMIAEALVPIFFVMFLGYFAGLACFVTGLVLSAQPLRLNANVGVGVLMKNMVLPLGACVIAVALGMSAEIAREAILLTSQMK